MTINRLLKTIRDEYQKSLEGTLFDAEDNMKFSASIPVVDKIAYSEALFYSIIKDVLDNENKNVDFILNSLIKRINVLNGTKTKLPLFNELSQNPANYQRFKEIDDDTFFFATSNGAGSLAVYMSGDRCNSFRRVGGYSNLPETDSKYSKGGLASIDLLKDEVTLEDGSKIPTARIFWIDSNYRIKNSVINPLNGIFLDEEVIVDNTIEKKVGAGEFFAIKNANDDKLIVYSEKNGDYFDVKAMVKGGGKSIWINIPLLSNNGKDDYVEDVIEVDGTFYVVVTNRTDRMFLAKIEKNEQGDFESTIISVDGKVYKDLRLFKVGNDLLIVSSTQNILAVDLTKDFFFVEKNTKLVGGSTRTGYFTIFEDGRYVAPNTNKIYNFENEMILELPEKINTEIPATMLIEYKTLIPYIENGSDGQSVIRLLDVYDISDDKPAVKGL